MKNKIPGRALYKMLPQELRDRLPVHLRRVVIDIPYDGPVRILCDTIADEDIAPLVDAVLRADVEIVEAKPSIVEIPEDATLVFHVPGMLAREAYRRLIERMRAAFTRNKVIVLENGISLEVVKTESKDED